MTPRQRRFVQEYLVDLNATQAAKRAGYGKDSVWRLLRNPVVAAAIEKAQAKRAERTRVSADKVVTELAKVAFGDPRRLFSWGPGGVVLRDSADLTEAEAALVSEVSETRTSKGGTRKVKLHCKLTALNALGKHLGIFGNGRKGARAPGGATDENGEAQSADDARDRLARRIAGLAARLGTKDPDRGAD
ncbi:MAG: terminase small subunit [Alphaproteobacteria bacterium]